MQLKNHSQSLLNKFILNQCNKEEVEKVVAYIQKLNKSDQLPSVEDVLELLDEKPVMSPADATQIHDNIMEMVKQKEKESIKKRLYIWRYVAVATVFGILSTAYILKDSLFSKSTDITPEIVESYAIVQGSDRATLTLEDGTMITLEKGRKYQAKNVISNGEEIVYKYGKSNSKEIVYNYLTIPRGGQFLIKLEDGTRVWLNSESQLKYPVSFNEGETRQVELVYGEAYFDVSPSSEHKGAKFKVLNPFQEVEVLGTEFNIKAYKDEANIYTTLVEGKVVISNGLSKQNLIPNQQSNLDKTSNGISIYKIDVKAEISWKEGVFSFIDKPLSDIMKVISRWYDVDIIFENKKLESKEFIGVLDKRQSIEEILSIIKSTSINSYEINNKTIILK